MALISRQAGHQSAATAALGLPFLTFLFTLLARLEIETGPPT
jgi:hypothetical protein